MLKSSAMSRPWGWLGTSFTKKEIKQETGKNQIADDTTAPKHLSTPTSFPGPFPDPGNEVAQSLANILHQMKVTENLGKYLKFGVELHFFHPFFHTQKNWKTTVNLTVHDRWLAPLSAFICFL